MSDPQQPVPTLVTYGDNDTSHLPELMHCELISVRSREHEYRIHPHRHHGLSQVFVIRRGSGEASLDGQISMVEAPALLVIPEFCVHDFRWSGDVEGVVFSVANELIHQLEQQFGAIEPLFSQLRVVGLQQTSGVFEWVNRLHQEYVRDEDRWRTGSLAAALYQTAVAMAREIEDASQGEREQNAARHLLLRFRHLVNEHYAKHWKVEEYASQLGVTAPHLSSVCRSETGMSALALIHQRVLLEARRCLHYTAMPVSRIGYQLGFQDPAYFTRFIKRQLGMSPAQYRRQFAEDQEPEKR